MKRLRTRAASLEAIDYRNLPTEQSHTATTHLNRLPLASLLRLMNREDLKAVRAISPQLSSIERATRLITQTLRKKGRLFFIGAGTSGRLGIIEAAECPPTFHTDEAMVQAIIAGGHKAVFRSQENVEDDGAQARRIARQRIHAADVAVGISASGVSPFVAEALKEAKRLGAKTVLVSCHPRSPILADVRIRMSVGPEIISGSTRLKCGTATKLVLNMLTVGAMVQLGRTAGNRMVDVRPTSQKLRARALRIVQELTGLDESEAARALKAALGHAKMAILMARERLSISSARRRLAQAQGSLAQAMARNGTQNLH